MATHSSILAWEIPWTEEPGGLQVHVVSKESDMTSQLNKNYKKIPLSLSEELRLRRALERDSLGLNEKVF